MSVGGGADTKAAADPAATARAARWAFLGGNFAIGCGVMVTAGSLNDLVNSLRVSVATGGQLVTIAAIVMGVSAPLMAAAVGGICRRRLLTFCLVWYAAGHALSALMPHYAALVPVRGLTVLAAALFTPQAAAAIGQMSPPDERGRAITFVFLGWSVASVIGMPLHAYVGEAYGWRWAFALVALMSLLAATAVWRVVPDGLRLPALTGANWGSIFTRPALIGIPLVTVLSGAGQFTVFTYFAPYYRQELGASPAQASLLFMWFGAFGLLGNVLVSRWIDRTGTARAVAVTLALMALSLALWPLAGTLGLMAAVLVPWALGCFSSNSAQQARAALAAPAFGPALIALNTSAIYLGQAIGAAGGGALVAGSGFRWLWALGLAWMLAAIVLSAWVSRQPLEAGVSPAGSR